MIARLDVLTPPANTPENAKAALRGHRKAACTFLVAGAGYTKRIRLAFQVAQDHRELLSARTVSDAGCGNVEADWDRIFDAFLSGTQ
jgi:hypothetical protein